MKVLKLKAQDETIIIPAVEEGTTTINISDISGAGSLYAGSLKNNSDKQNIWCNYSSIELGSTFQIEIIESKEITQPRQVLYVPSSKRISKLEIFLDLEKDVKEGGFYERIQSFYQR